MLSSTPAARPSGATPLPQRPPPVRGGGGLFQGQRQEFGGGFVCGVAGEGQQGMRRCLRKCDGLGRWDQAGWMWGLRE